MDRSNILYLDIYLTLRYNKYIGWQGLVPPIQWSLTGILHPLLPPNQDHGVIMSYHTSKNALLFNDNSTT